MLANPQQQMGAISQFTSLLRYTLET